MSSSEFTNYMYVTGDALTGVTKNKKNVSERI